MDNDINDKYPDSYKENWNGIIGLFLFPVLLLIFGISLVRNISPVTNSVTTYLPAVGIGGAPPQLKPQQISNDKFVINDATLSNNRLSGYIDKDLYDQGARVFLYLAMNYKQQCVNGNQTSSETQNVVLSKNADNYQSTNNNQYYEWTINIQINEPTDLCPNDSSNGDNMNRDLVGKVYLSTNQGAESLVDEESNKPYEIFLDL